MARRPCIAMQQPRRTNAVRCPHERQSGAHRRRRADRSRPRPVADAPGVRVRIVDKAAEPGTTSRALAVQARTLEFYRQVGLADTLVEGGRDARRRQLLGRAAGAWRARCSARWARAEPVPVRADLPAGRARALADRRAWPKRREGRATRSSCSGSRTPARASSRGCGGADGSEEALRRGLPRRLRRRPLDRARGARRRIPRRHVRAPVLRRRRGRARPGRERRAARVARRGGVRRRLPAARARAARDSSASCASEVATQRRDGARPGTTSSTDLLGRMRVEVERVNWFSTYRVHHRVADRFRSGRAFLLGDAAHIHSPVGGQGMNTGIGDAVNLAWKLAARAHGRRRARRCSTPTRRSASRSPAGSSRPPTARSRSSRAADARAVGAAAAWCRA